MGVAEESEETEEYCRQIAQMKRQISSLTGALAQSTTRKSEGDCDTEGCSRPIDWYCRTCKTFICTRCHKKPCGDNERHDVYEFEEIYASCKKKYVGWKGGNQAAIGSLSKQQKKLQDELAKEVQQMAAASPDDLLKPNFAKIISELPVKRKLLEDITKQVKEAEFALSDSGGNIETLSQQDFIKVFYELNLSDSLFEVTDLNKVTLMSNCTILWPKQCYHLDITPSGDILLAVNNGFHICSASGNVLRTIPCAGKNTTSIQYYKGKIYALVMDSKDSKKRDVVVYDANTYDELNRWALSDYAYVSMLAVSNDKVYVVDSDKKTVKIYSLDGKPKPDFFNSAFRDLQRMCYCHPDGILLADWGSGIVYKVDCSTDRIAWQFEVTSPRAVCCDKRGIVWVWSTKEKALYLRSADRTKWKKYNHSGIEKAGIEDVSGMCRAEGKLYLATIKGLFSITVSIDE